jgi:hypothetical protein
MGVLGATGGGSTVASSLLSRLVSPAADPGHISTEHTVKIDGGFVRWQTGECRPKVELIALAVTLMAVVPADGHVHRELAAAPMGHGIVQRTVSVPLIASAVGRLEANQVEYLLHRDLGAQLLEVDAWHD